MELFEYIDFMRQPYDIFYTDSVNSALHWHYYSEILYSPIRTTHTPHSTKLQNKARHCLQRLVPR